MWCLQHDRPNALFILTPRKHAFNLEKLINLNFINHVNFQSLEVVYRGSETQLQVTENFN